MRKVVLSRQEAFFLSIAALLLGSFIIWNSLRTDFPERSTLVESTGKVEWAQSTKGAVRFKLTSDLRSFQYSSIGGNSGWVYESLKHSGGALVSVLLDASRSRTPIFSKVEYFDVYEVAVAGRGIQSYSSVRSSWEFDSSVGVGLGLAFLLAGFYHLYARYSSRNET